MQEGDPISEILVDDDDDDDDIDNYRFVCHQNDAEINLLGVDAAQNDYDGLFLFANQWKGWALIAAPPKIGATSRAKRSLTTLNNAWIESETARRRSELESKSSEFANQWKSVLLKYNQKLSKIEEEKAASRSTNEIPPFRPVFLDLRGIHSEQQILLGIWRQLNICNARDITNLHEMLLGYFSQPSKVTILVFDHVSRIAASNLVKLFGHISDLIGVVIIAEMMLNPSLLLQEKEDKDALIGNMFVDELVQFSSALSLPWDINTDRENERILVFSGTLTNRSTRSLVLSKLGYLIADITLSSKLNVKSSVIDGGHSEIDSEAVKSDSKDFTSLSPEQQAMVIETVDIVTDLSNGIPGVIFSLLQLELPILRQLYNAKQATKSVRVRLLSTNKFVNAGRVFSVVAKLYSAVFNSIISVAKDRSDLMAILYFSYPRVLDTAKISWNDAEHYSLSSLLSMQDLNAQGISDGFLLSLVSKGFLIHLSTVDAFVMPQIICHILIASKGDDSIEERIRLKSFIFGQHCANLAREFGRILDQQWVSRAPDLKVVPISVLQCHIYLRRLEFVLPQIMSVVRSNCYNEESGISLASKDVVQSLALLVSAGGVVLFDWHSIDLKLHVVQLLSEMICSWSDGEIKRIFVTLLEVLGEKRAGVSVEVLLLHATETIHLALMEWWWLSGAETFSSKHLSAIKRQETAAKLRKMAIRGTELLDRLLCISRGLIDGAPSKATASVYLKSQLLMQSFKHKFFVTFALQSFALDQFQISQVVKFVDEFALPLRHLSTQIVSTLDSLDLSGLELDDDISNETSIEMSTLVDRLPVTQKLLMSLKQALRTRYNSLVGQEPSQIGDVGNSSSTDAHERRKGLSLMKREESVRNIMQMDLFQLSSEDIEKCMLIGVANNFPAIYEMVCGMLMKFLLRKHPISQHHVTTAGQSTVNTFSFPSVSSDLVYRGRLLFSLSLARQFSEAFASPSSTLWLRTDEESSYITEGMGLLNTMGVCDTDIDGLLWSAYLQRVSDHQEGLSSTPWRTVAATIYSHPTITKAESVAMKSIRSVLRQMAQYMRMARQEYEKLYDVVDFATENEAAADVERKGTNWANHLALANVSSITVANAGILYADIIACLVQFGETFVPSKDSTIDEDDEDDNLDDVFEAREICEDSLQIWSHIVTRNHLKDQSARLVFGFSYYLMYELSMFALKVQSADPSLIMSERYQGSHKSFAHLSAKEALLRLEQRQRESQFWELSFHYHNSSFQILKRIALPGTYRQCIALISISGLNDYHEYCRYQVEIKRLMEPGKGGSESNNITEMHLPQELLETIHSMTKTLQQLVQYNYHHSRRLLDNEILSFYALATLIQLQQGHESHSVLRVLQINASRDSLTDNEHQQQCYIYSSQCRLQQLSVQQLLLLFCARVYDSIIGAQSVAVAPLIATNVALPFAHPQYSSNQTSASSTSSASHEISCTGYNRAMDMFKYIMSHYRDLSILIYAQELWDSDNVKGFPRSSSKRAKLKQSQKELLQTITIWGQIVESVFPHPYDLFFKHPEQSDTAQDASDIVPGKSRRKAVGGRSPNNPGEESISTPWTIAALDPNDTELDRTQNESRLHTVEGDSYLAEKRIGALRETYSSLALRFADVMYLFGETLYRDGLSQYKLTPQLNDEMCELIFQQHVAAIAAARQLYEQELTPRQYCPLSLIMYRHLAQHQIAQNDLDSAIKSFEEMLRIFLETKFTSLLVLAEIYTEYGDALMLKKEHFHASLMYQMAIDYYRDYDVDAVAESQVRLGAAASTELHPVVSEGDESPTTSLEYVWSLFIPPHLQAKEITEGFLKERIARNLIAKAKAVFAGDDFEQAQELAEQTQHILTFYMPNLTKIDDEEAIKQEKRELRKIENMPPSTTNVSRVDKEPKDSLRVIDEEAGEDGERDEGNEGKPTAADLRAVQEEQEMNKQEREMRRQIICSPVAVEVYLLLALVHYQFDEFEEAERYFQKGEVAMEELGEEESLTMIKIYHNRGILLHSKVNLTVVVVCRLWTHE